MSTTLSQPQTGDEPTTEDLLSLVEKQSQIIDDLQEQVDELQERVDDVEKTTQIHDTRLDAMDGAIEDHDQALAEQQSRELEKGYHLEWETVERRLDDLRVDGDRVERFAGDDDRDYARLPGEADPLERSGTSALATADLLPIQQLAQMDDDMLANATSKRPDYIAAKVWDERGKHGGSTLWNQGSGEVREYVDAGEMKIWIKREMERADEDMSDDYAKQLAGRTIERIRKLAKDRVFVQKRNHRKDGLQYQERRLILPSDSEIPGETSSNDTPGTNEVAG